MAGLLGVVLIALSACSDPIYGTRAGVDSGGRPLYRYCNGYGKCRLSHDRCIGGGWGTSCCPAGWGTSC